MVRSQVRAAGTVLVVVAVLATVMVGASADRSWDLQERDFGGWAIWNAQNEPPEQPRPGERTGSLDEFGARADPVAWSWLGVVGQGLLAIAAVFALFWLWIWIRARLVLRRPVPASDAAGDMAAEPQPELPVLRRGIREARRYLQEIADPTDAVIVAWLSLEEAAASSGVRRRASQTPTEFTVAVLQRTDADPSATMDLLSVYHRARFSGAAVTGEHVTVALQSFGRIAASWDALTSAPTPAVSEDTRSTGPSAERASG